MSLSAFGENLIDQAAKAAAARIIAGIPEADDATLRKAMDRFGPIIRDAMEKIVIEFARCDTLLMKR